jgi:hypothetical protein
MASLPLSRFLHVCALRFGDTGVVCVFGAPSVNITHVGTPERDGRWGNKEGKVSCRPHAYRK